VLKAQPPLGTTQRLQTQPGAAYSGSPVAAQTLGAMAESSSATGTPPVIPKAQIPTAAFFAAGALVVVLAMVAFVSLRRPHGTTTQSAGDASSSASRASAPATAPPLVDVPPPDIPMPTDTAEAPPTAPAVASAAPHATARPASSGKPWAPAPRHSGNWLDQR
jgi:hypothetical protein